jgi:hypothetical protein
LNQRSESDTLNVTSDDDSVGDDLISHFRSRAGPWRSMAVDCTGWFHVKRFASQAAVRGGSDVGMRMKLRAVATCCCARSIQRHSTRSTGVRKRSVRMLQRDTGPSPQDPEPSGPRRPSDTSRTVLPSSWRR